MSICAGPRRGPIQKQIRKASGKVCSCLTRLSLREWKEIPGKSIGVHRQSIEIAGNQTNFKAQCSGVLLAPSWCSIGAHLWHTPHYGETLPETNKVGKTADDSTECSQYVSIAVGNQNTITRKFTNSSVMCVPCPLKFGQVRKSLLR